MSSVYDPVEGIRICDWMPRCLVQAFGESSDFTPPALCLPGLRTERTPCPSWHLLPLPPPHEPCLHPNPCWWSGLSFLWNQHWLLVCGWLHLSTHPNQCCDSVFIVFWERRVVQLREAEGLSQELTTASPFMRVFTLHMSTGFSFASQSRDSSSHILTMSCAHLTAHHHKDAASFPCVHIPANTLPLGKFFYRTTALS